MKNVFLAIMVCLMCASASAGEILKLTDIREVKISDVADSRIKVTVEALLHCGNGFLGVLHRVMPAEESAVPTVEIRAVVADHGKACLAKDQFVRDSFELPAGTYNFQMIQP